jgi:hypothetical protein
MQPEHNRAFIIMFLTHFIVIVLAVVVVVAVVVNVIESVFLGDLALKIFNQEPKDPRWTTIFRVCDHLMGHSD